MSIGPIRAVPVRVRDLETGLGLFHDVIGPRVESEQTITPPLLTAWGLPAATSARLVELSCEGHEAGRLQLIVYEPAPTAAVQADAHSGPNTALTSARRRSTYIRACRSPARSPSSSGQGFRPALRRSDIRSGRCRPRSSCSPGPTGSPFSSCTQTMAPGSSDRPARRRATARSRPSRSCATISTRADGSTVRPLGSSWRSTPRSSRTFAISSVS